MGTRQILRTLTGMSDAILEKARNIERELELLYRKIGIEVPDDDGTKPPVLVASVYLHGAKYYAPWCYYAFKHEPPTSERGPEGTGTFFFRNICLIPENVSAENTKEALVETGLPVYLTVSCRVAVLRNEVYGGAYPLPYRKFDVSEDVPVLIEVLNNARYRKMVQNAVSSAVKTALDAGSRAGSIDSVMVHLDTLTGDVSILVHNSKHGSRVSSGGELVLVINSNVDPDLSLYEGRWVLKPLDSTYEKFTVTRWIQANGHRVPLDVDLNVDKHIAAVVRACYTAPEWEAEPFACAVFGMQLRRLKEKVIYAAAPEAFLSMSP